MDRRYCGRRYRVLNKFNDNGNIDSMQNQDCKCYMYYSYKNNCHERTKIKKFKYFVLSDPDDSLYKLLKSNRGVRFQQFDILNRGQKRTNFNTTK